MLNPFEVAPAGPLQRPIAYWFATSWRAAYQPAANWIVQVGQAVGSVSVAIHGGFPPRVPLAYRIRLPGNRQVLVVLGTTSWQEYLAEVSGSALIPFPGVRGRVLAYLGITASQMNLALANVPLASYILTGHSLGGMVAAGLADLRRAAPPELVVDGGSPRNGDLVHATAQTVPRLRLTNQGDPAPLVPAGTNSLLDLLPLAVPSLPVAPIFSRHWGERVHLFADGSTARPPEQATPSEVATYLAGVILGGTGWYGAHATAEYARRLRAGIPAPFPLPAPDPEFDGVFELDAINDGINALEGITWNSAALVTPPLCR